MLRCAVALLAPCVLAAAAAAPQGDCAGLPAVINTWGFTHATQKAWEVMQSQDDALTAIELGCHVCEDERCDGTVGWGGSPDTNGETTLDAMIMDGSTMNVGSVGALRRVKNAIAVARKVLEHTTHTLLAGDQATEFAVQNFGFREESLTSNQSKQMYESWKAANCQPNFYTGLVNDKSSCPPYAEPQQRLSGVDPRQLDRAPHKFGPDNHDTIGMVAINSTGHVSCGTSTNGARHKIAGRVGDSPIVGAGAYCDSDVGGAAATGDGDVMMRFLPAFYTVELMRQGQSPSAAAEAALRRIVAKYPTFSGSLVAMAKDGTYGAAAHGYTFPVSVASRQLGGVVVKQYPPISAP